MLSHSVVSDSLQPHRLWPARALRFSRQASWSGLPFPPPEDLPHPGMYLRYLLHWQAYSLPLCHLLAMTSCNYVLWASFAFAWEVIFPLRNCLKSLGSDESLGASHFSPPKAGRIENKKAWSPGQANYNLPLLHKGVTQPEMAWIPVWDFKEWGWERESFLPMVPLSLSKINLEMYMVIFLISEKLGDQVWKW